MGGRERGEVWMLALKRAESSGEVTEVECVTRPRSLIGGEAIG